jgi:tetratricopeptide (TPR) repeat protein
MKHVVVAAMLFAAACRGGNAPSGRKDAGHDRPAFRVSVVPELARTEDGTAELRVLDKSIEAQRGDLLASGTLRLERAAIRGQLDDYERALADSAALVAKTPSDERAWRLRINALMRVHEFSAARDAMKQLAAVVHPSHLVEYEVALADATAGPERSLAGREQLAKNWPNPTRLTLQALALAQLGRSDEAKAMIPKAAAALHNNPPQLVAWLLFQWGRIYELHGELATAREFYAAARERMPAHLDATVHLAETMSVGGDTAGARKLVDDALAENRHPELLALAVKLGRTELAEAARAEWERYVAALPHAFADHAARFYLGVGKNPGRALELARINHANRDTPHARSLVVEAALAAGDAAAACALVGPLVSGGTRAHRFVAWQALSRCGRTADADRIARDLGIAH